MTTPAEEVLKALPVGAFPSNLMLNTAALNSTSLMIPSLCYSECVLASVSLRL